MLVRHGEGQMRRALAPLLVPDADRDEAKGLPVHGLCTWLQDLATLTRNEGLLPGCPDAILPLLAEPSRVRARALALPG